MHMMDLAVEDKDWNIIEKPYIAYVGKKLARGMLTSDEREHYNALDKEEHRNSISSRNKPIVQQVLNGEFDGVKTNIRAGNSDFANPFLLNDILLNAISTEKSNKEEKIQFIKQLLALKPLANLIKEIPYSLYGRAGATGQYFIDYQSPIKVAVIAQELDIIQIFNELDAGETVRNGNGLEVASINGLDGALAVILSQYKIFTNKEINVINQVEEIIKERNLRSSQIKEMLDKIREYELLHKSNEDCVPGLKRKFEYIAPEPTQSIYEDEISVSSVNPDGVKSGFLQRFIFDGKLHDAKDYINGEGKFSESQPFKSFTRPKTALKLMLDTMLYNNIKTEEEEGVHFIKFLLSFDAVKLALKSGSFIYRAVTNNCLEVMKLFISLDAEAVSKSNALLISFEKENVEMFKLLMNCDKVSARDIEEIKKWETVRSSTDFYNRYNRTDHLERVLLLLNSKRLELSNSSSTLLPRLSPKI